MYSIQRRDASDCGEPIITSCDTLTLLCDSEIDERELGAA